MDFTWLRTFVTAAKYENFRQTAEILFISQPSVTVHIKLLEEELGVQLFDRSRRNIHLTLEGRHFLHHAELLLKQYQKGVEDLQSFIQGYSQKLNLAISPLIADTILPSVLKQYLKAHSDIEINITVLDSRYIEENVLNGVVHVGISCLPATNRKLFCEKLYEDPVIFVVPHDGLDLETGTPIDEEEILEKNRLFTHSHPEYWDKLLPYINGKYPHVKTIKVSEVHITKRFITEGLGVSYLPASTVRRELLEGRIIDVPSNITLPIAKTFAIYQSSNIIVEDFLHFLMKFHF